MTFSGSKSAWIFGWFFIEDGLQKQAIFNEKTIQKTRRFPSLSKIFFFAFLERSGTVPDDRIHFVFPFFRFLAENGHQKATPWAPISLSFLLLFRTFHPKAPQTPPGPLPDAPKDHFGSISGPFRDDFVRILGSFWHNSRTILG